MAKSFDTMVLGAGTVYYDYDGVGEVELGYTRGGEFTDGLEHRVVSVDGMKSPLKYGRVIDMMSPVLSVTFLQWDATEWQKLLAPINVADAASIKTITRKYARGTSDYLSKITWVGTTFERKEVQIELTEVLGLGVLALTLEDKSEVEIPVEFHAHGAAITDTAAPFSIIIDETE